ncbi:MarR family winged helix-turn-helix transcriptional regulator [Methanobrevibacter curvatus]|uniref:Transcriptional regulator HosA n=1 Tax=Methanobrevibacter curvatus TaxID=49547 RepID=A0A166D5M6_9EURY|nr:MarR family winged helix-turn-helix transcriptional regulator [Methanobrevibacter curvatus]KZX15232.1 transcriptional regulator HosA [Methanobrevibacter curvatus]
MECNFDENDLIWSFHKLKNLVYKKLQKGLQKYGITITQWTIMNYIYKNPGINQKKISDMLKKDRGEISRNLNKLGNLEIIEKKISYHDKREYLIYLTNEGEKILLKTCCLVKELNKDLEKGFKKEEIKKYQEFINKIIINVKNTEK